MSTPAFTGSLQPKKKADLQEIATALQISDTGTKEELQNRIKDHLDRNQFKLEEDPAFSGLYGRIRKRRGPSAQPQPQPAVGRFAPADESSSVERSPTRSSRRATAMDPVRESTPVEEEDNRNVSSFLGRFGISSPSSADNSRALIASPAKSIRDIVPSTDTALSVMKQSQEQVLQQGGEKLLALRTFLSNSTNIWSLSALFEFLFILYEIIPWAYVDLPLSPTSSKGGSTLAIPYPPLAAFQQEAFWKTLGHWALPALFIPALIGTLISFRPAPQSSAITPNTINLPFDALTASIIRLAAQIAYPYPAIDKSIKNVDVLGWQWRVVAAGVGVAFAFAEAISGSLIPRSVVVEDEEGELTQLQIEG